MKTGFGGHHLGGAAEELGHLGLHLGKVVSLGQRIVAGDPSGHRNRQIPMRVGHRTTR